MISHLHCCLVQPLPELPGEPDLPGNLATQIAPVVMEMFRVGVRRRDEQ